MAQEQNLVTDVAKTAIKMAVKKALFSAGVSIAPYLGIGCLIVLGIFLFVIVVCVIFVVMTYAMCNYAPTTIKFATWVSSFLPAGFSPTTSALSVLGPICDIFNQ